MERAKARREKLNMQLSNAGHDPKERRSPLKDANALLLQASGSNIHFSIHHLIVWKLLFLVRRIIWIIRVVLALKSTTVSKPTVKESPAKQSPVKSSRKLSPPKTPTARDPSKESNKENGDNQVSNVRSKLQRLGKLYSGKLGSLGYTHTRWYQKLVLPPSQYRYTSNSRLELLAEQCRNTKDHNFISQLLKFHLTEDSSRELSSPIHRTEERFAIEEEPVNQKPAKPGARLGRLAALASTINNWEDDLSHPSIVRFSTLIRLALVSKSTINRIPFHRQLPKQTESRASKVQAKFNEQSRNGNEPQPSTSGMSRQSSTSGLGRQQSTSGLPKPPSTSGLSKLPSSSCLSKPIGSNRSPSGNQANRGKGSPTKQLKWDQAMLETLVRIGFCDYQIFFSLDSVPCNHLHELEPLTSQVRRSTQ